MNEVNPGNPRVSRYTLNPDCATATPATVNRATQSPPDSAARSRFALHRRALDRPVGAKHAAVATPRAQQRLAARTFVVELAGVEGHGFAPAEPACGAGQHGFESAHPLLTCAG